MVILKDRVSNEGVAWRVALIEGNADPGRRSPAGPRLYSRAE